MENVFRNSFFAKMYPLEEKLFTWSWKKRPNGRRLTPCRVITVSHFNWVRNCFWKGQIYSVGDFYDTTWAYRTCYTQKLYNKIIYVLLGQTSRHHCPRCFRHPLPREIRSSSLLQDSAYFNLRDEWSLEYSSKDFVNHECLVLIPRAQEFTQVQGLDQRSGP